MFIFAANTFYSQNAYLIRCFLNASGMGKCGVQLQIICAYIIVNKPNNNQQYCINTLRIYFNNFVA